MKLTCKDPDLLVLERPSGRRMILALDLGTTTGAAIAWVQTGRPVDPASLSPVLGLWDLSAGPYDSGSLRFVRLRQFLHVCRPDLVVVEDVKYVPPETPNRVNARAIVARAATACEWFGALKATVCTWCHENEVPCGSFPIGTIKKRATGKGNSGKAEVIKAANELWSLDLDPETYESTGVDNLCDAGFLCLLAAENYAAGMSPSDSASDQAT